MRTVLSHSPSNSGLEGFTWIIKELLHCENIWRCKTFSTVQCYHYCVRAHVEKTRTHHRLRERCVSSTLGARTAPTWSVSDFILIRSVIIARASRGENSSRGAHWERRDARGPRGATSWPASFRNNLIRQPLRPLSLCLVGPASARHALAPHCQLRR